MKALRIFTRLLLSAIVLAAASASAQLTIDVTTSAGRQIPVAVVPFGGEDASTNVTPVIGADLSRTGLFRLPLKISLRRARGLPRSATPCATCAYANRPSRTYSSDTAMDDG